MAVLGHDSIRHESVTRGQPFHPTASVLLTAVALAVLLGGFPAETEIVFHRRDHLDQGNYLSNQPVYNVRSYSDALVSQRLRILILRRE